MQKTYREIVVYLQMLKIHFLSGLEYRGWWLMVLQVLLVVASDTVSTVLMFARFGGIGVWTAERIILIYSLATTSFGLAESFCRGFDYFPWKMIRSGDFDRLLLRPCSLFTQVAGSFFHIHRLARVAAGLGMVLWSLSRQGVPATAANCAVLLLALAGGAVMYCGVFVLSSGVAFFTVKALDWIYILTNASYQVTRCPVDHLPRLMKYAFTFVVPIFVISYLPAAAVCGWGSYPAGFLALPAGLAFMGVSLLVWRTGVAHYQSTGS